MEFILNVNGHVVSAVPATLRIKVKAQRTHKESVWGLRVLQPLPLLRRYHLHPRASLLGHRGLRTHQDSTILMDFHCSHQVDLVKFHHSTETSRISALRGLRSLLDRTWKCFRVSSLVSLWVRTPSIFSAASSETRLQVNKVSCFFFF